MKGIKFNAPVTLWFAMIAFAALILSIFTGGYTNRLFFSVYKASWADPLHYIRLIGHVFGHASVEHFTGNMMIILLLGPLLEEKYGGARLMFLIFITALITGLVHIFVFDTGLLGASGVCFAMIMLASFTKTSGSKIPVTAILVAMLYLGNELYSAILIRDNIANSTHIIGGIVGATFGFLMRN